MITIVNDSVVIMMMTILKATATTKIDKDDDIVQYYSNSIANVLELLQSCTKPSIYNPMGDWLFS